MADSTIDAVRQRYHEVILAKDLPPAVRDWRLGQFERGLALADEIEALIGVVAGKRVLDVGAAFGGHVAAMQARGALCVGADLVDHDYPALREHLAANGNGAEFVRFDCTVAWPLTTAGFDVVISLGTLEFVDNLELVFSETARMLKPGGIAMLNTPTSLRGIRRDAHYKLPLIALLPPHVRRWVAETIFHRSYPFPLSCHTYFSARHIRRYAMRQGLTIAPLKLAGSPIMARIGRWPLGRAWQRLIRHVAFDFVLLIPRNGRQGCHLPR